MNKDLENKMCKKKIAELGLHLEKKTQWENLISPFNYRITFFKEDSD